MNQKEELSVISDMPKLQNQSISKMGSRTINIDNKPSETQPRISRKNSRSGHNISPAKKLVWKKRLREYDQYKHQYKLSKQYCRQARGKK